MFSSVLSAVLLPSPTGDSVSAIVLKTLLLGLIPALIGYLLGSVNTAVVISRVFYHDDVRTHGSGNGGTTNVMRTYGKTAAIGTFVGDLAKTALSVFLGFLLMGETGAYIGGFASVVGHVFPCFFGFRGGKGVACVAALVLCTEPVAFVVLILMFIGIVAATKFISLGSVMGVMLYPLVLNRVYVLMHHTNGVPFVPTVISFLLMVLVIVKHRENIRRLLNGTESKFSFKKSVKPTEQKETTGSDDTSAPASAEKDSNNKKKK